MKLTDNLIKQQMFETEIHEILDMTGNYNNATELQRGLIMSILLLAATIEGKNDNNSK